MNYHPKIENGIKPFIDYEHRSIWDELRQGDAVIELAEYILEKNKTRNMTDYNVDVLADLLSNVNES